MKGTFCKIPWTAELGYSTYKRDNCIDTMIYWLCPVHKTPLRLKETSAQSGLYHELHCPKCNKTHSMKSKDTIIFLEDAERIVRQQILQKINLPNSDK